MLEMEDHFGTPVLEAYGMTEAAHQMASNPLPDEKRVPGSVGRGTGVSVSIMDEEGNLLYRRVSGRGGHPGSLTSSAATRTTPRPTPLPSPTVGSGPEMRA